MDNGVIKIGLLGLGTVGGGVVKVLEKNGEDIEKKVGKKIEIGGVLVRDISEARSFESTNNILTSDPADILDNDEIDIVVEVMGGIDAAKDCILRALEKQKPVITANKDLIASYGRELFEMADSQNTDFYFEASVAGGIPIIRPMKECLCGNRIEAVMGIINGTTNYILTKMTYDHREFEDVLKEAQDLGYAEADPTSDIEGHDAAYKIAILASIAFNSRITHHDVHLEGISKINSDDIRYAQELGYVIKLLGIAKQDDTGAEVRVHPAFIPDAHPLASVHNEYNAIYVKGDAVGETMFYGKGAGELPTASAVVGDIISAARNLHYGISGRVGCTCFNDIKIKPMREMEAKYYLRLKVNDQPGVLANIAGVFGNTDVSLASVIQKRLEGEKAEIVLVTHKVREGNLQDALKIIEGLSVVDTIGNVIRVEGGE